VKRQIFVAKTPKKQQELQQLVVRRRQLVELGTAETDLLNTCSSKSVRERSGIYGRTRRAPRRR
jgi:hypothetical protein